ncbi:MAG: hypothetical protein HYV27_00845, partial [Candidatus Hydrogenedentes bacterium]|nr:hypothetical protein [Candidatus Hydrogenedentota bacterium]
MSRLPLPLCLSLLLCLTAASQDWEQQLIGDRDAANALFESGQLMEGATRLITGMHALPTDQPALVDPAAGNVQFLIFALEYLMTEEQVNTFTTQVLDTENNEFDNFIANLYNLQIGQESFGKTITTQDLQQMTASSNVFVRVGTLFILCEPYYFQDPIFVQQHLDILAAEFPTLGVTQEALLMADLAAQQQQQQQPEPEPETQAKSVDSGPALIAEDPSPAELQQMAASQRTRPDSQFLVRARGALGDLRNDTRRTGALGVLAEVAAND